MQIFSAMRDRSMQTKTFFSLGIIGFLSLSGMLLGYLCSRTVAAEYGHMLKANSRLEVLAVRIADHMHRVSRDEFAFIMQRDAQLITHRQESLDHVYEDLREVKGLEQDIIPVEQLNKFEADIKSYQTYFEIIARRLTEEGHADSGFLGALRIAAHQIEKTLKANTSPDQPIVMVSYLTIRRHEKDYLARRDRSYIDKLNQEADRLAGILAKSAHFKADEKKAILESSGVYREKLGLMDEGYKDLLNQRKKQDAALHDIEILIAQVNESVTNHNSAQMTMLGRLVDSVNLIFLVAGIMTVFIIALSAREFSLLTRSLIELSHTIRGSGDRNLKTSISLQTTSEKTSAAVTEQASAIQESVATINEISAMVDKSVESASLSAKKAEMSFQISMEGKKSVDSMRDAMESIKAAMSGMISQNSQGNQSFRSILSIIEKIAERTNVINDIVFQTKLLSFNASVEAARAGEHGKGFAVVAEEVGNLARMSGEAARAIGELLHNSRAEVATIIQDSREQADQLSRTGTERVEAGVGIANRCDEILSEVVEHVESVKTLMGEIASAAKEEADGISNITAAMNELDDTTAINSDMAHETMTFSSVLNREAQALNKAVQKLSRIVLGARVVVVEAEADGDGDGDEDSPDDRTPLAA